MAKPAWPDLNPWRPRSLAIPPESMRAWISLAAWEFWMGALLSGALVFGGWLIVTASGHIVTVFDFTNCYASPVIQPCERVAYRAGLLNVVMNVWFGVVLIAVAVWLVWELWSVAAPKPVTDEFLQLLDDSFGRDWRKPGTWPWARMAWAYGFTLVGATSAVGLGLLVSAMLSSSGHAKPPIVHVETSQRFRQPAAAAPVKP